MFRNFSPAPTPAPRHLSPGQKAGAAGGLQEKAAAMKIISWNINGLRACLAKRALDWVWAQNPDVVCLQEIKVHPSQLTEEQNHFPGYEVIWNPAQKLGYSGVATFLRTPVVETRLGLDMLRFDMEGRVISTLHPDFRLFNIYFPNGQRGQERLTFKLDFYAHLLSLCDRLHAQGERVIITGDFNTAHQPIDLRHPRANEKNSGFLPEERAWVQNFLDHGFVDIYRRMYPERIQYTWWTYISNARQRGVGWRIDYFLISETLVPRVKDVTIHEAVPGSDHCPVELVIE